MQSGQLLFPCGFLGPGFLGHLDWDKCASRAGPEAFVKVGAGMHHANSSSLLLLFWTVWHWDMSRQHPLPSLFFFHVLGIPCRKMSNQSQILLFLSKRVETFQSKKSLNSSGMDGTPKGGVVLSASCVPFILMCVVLVFLL